MANSKLVYDVEDKPKFGEMLVFAFQQVLAVLAATIAVPTIIGVPADIPAAILGAGLGTIVYLLFTKFKSPVIISSSFAFLGPLTNAIAFGYMGIALGGLFAGLVYVIIAVLVHFVGTNWISKLFPSVIIGPTVALIGLSLAGSAMGDMVKANGDPVNGGYNLVAVLCGLVTFFTVVFCSVQNKRKGLRLLPFICGIGAGYLTASIFSIIGYCADVNYLKIVDWSVLVDNFKEVKFTSFLNLPHMSLVEGFKELFGKGGNTLGTRITWAGVAEVALAFVPVAFVTYAEHVADHINLGTIINRHLIREEPGLTRTLLGDGVGSIVGTFFGVCPNTTYGESVGCVAITKNASVRTILTAAIMLIILSFLTPITCALRTIPSCVMGGVCLTLYGFIAVSGLKMFREIDLSENKNLYTVAAILIAGIGGLSIEIPYAINAVSQQSTAFTLVDGVATEVALVTDKGEALYNFVKGGVAHTISITSIATALILGIVTNKICLAIEAHNLPEEKEVPEETVGSRLAAYEEEKKAKESAEKGE